MLNAAFKMLLLHALYWYDDDMSNFSLLYPEKTLTFNSSCLSINSKFICCELKETQWLKSSWCVLTLDLQICIHHYNYGMMSCQLVTTVPKQLREWNVKCVTSLLVCPKKGSITWGGGKGMSWMLCESSNPCKINGV